MLLISGNIKEDLLSEARPASPFIDSEGNEYSDEDRSDELTLGLFDQIYLELCPEGSDWKKKTKLPELAKSARYDYDELGVYYDGNILIYGDSDDKFDSANKIAQAYGLEITEPKQAGKHKVVKITISQ